MCLRDTTRLDDAADPQGQPGLEQFLFGMRKAEVREDVAAALLVNANLDSPMISGIYDRRSRRFES